MGRPAPFRPPCTRRPSPQCSVHYWHPSFCCSPARPASGSSTSGSTAGAQQHALALRVAVRRLRSPGSRWTSPPRPPAQPTRVPWRSTRFLRSICPAQATPSGMSSLETLPCAASRRSLRLRSSPWMSRAEPSVGASRRCCGSTTLRVQLGTPLGRCSPRRCRRAWCRSSAPWWGGCAWWACRTRRCGETLGRTATCSPTWSTTRTAATRTAAPSATSSLRV